MLLYNLFIKVGIRMKRYLLKISTYIVLIILVSCNENKIDLEIGSHFSRYDLDSNLFVVGSAQTRHLKNYNDEGIWYYIGVTNDTYTTPQN
jgi:hypothetical protein